MKGAEMTAPVKDVVEAVRDEHVWPHPTLIEQFAELEESSATAEKNIKEACGATAGLLTEHRLLMQNVADTVRLAIMQRDNAEDALAAQVASMEAMKKDAEMLEWISVEDRSIQRRKCDMNRSDPCIERAVSFYILGRYTTVDGKTLREAIQAAMDKYAALAGER